MNTDEWTAVAHAPRPRRGLVAVVWVLCLAPPIALVPLQLCATAASSSYLTETDRLYVHPAPAAFWQGADRRGEHLAITSAQGGLYLVEPCGGRWSARDLAPPLAPGAGRPLRAVFCDRDGDELDELYVLAYPPPAAIGVFVGAEFAHFAAEVRRQPAAIYAQSAGEFRLQRTARLPDDLQQPLRHIDPVSDGWLEDWAAMLSGSRVRVAGGLRGNWVDAGDLDGDGRPELITVEERGARSGVIHVYRVVGVRAVEAWSAEAPSLYPESAVEPVPQPLVACADLDADGRAELFMGDADGGAVRVLRCRAGGP